MYKKKHTKRFRFKIRIVKEIIQNFLFKKFQPLKSGIENEMDINGKCLCPNEIHTRHPPEIAVYDTNEV